MSAIRSRPAEGVGRLSSKLNVRLGLDRGAWKKLRPKRPPESSRDIPRLFGLSQAPWPTFDFVIQLFLLSRGYIADGF